MLSVFKGDSFDKSFDGERLLTQASKVFQLMKDAQWRTLHEIADVVHAPVQSIGSRLRGFRTAKFGKHVVNRRRRGDPCKGLFEYQLIVNPDWDCKDGEP